MSVKEQGVKLAADTTSGFIIGDSTNSNGLLVTLVTIAGRLLLEWFMYRREKRKDKKK
jgi:hypothetical protein